MEEFKNATFKEIITDSTPVEVGSTSGTVPGTADFTAVLKEVTNGKRIHKLEWGSKEYYGFLDSATNILSLHKPDGKNYQWLINDGDLLGTDWIVL